jgi:hypothetical protein
MDLERRIEMPPMEHVEQLASIGQQSQEKQKQPQKKKQPKPNIDAILEDEEHARQIDNDGHIDYRA